MVQKTRERREKGKQYDLDARHTWIDRHNHGILHFGLYPIHLRLDNIQFDFSNLTCAVTRLLLLFLITFIFKQSCRVMDRFVNELLTKSWGPYNKDVWTKKIYFLHSLFQKLEYLVKRFLS